MALSVKRFPVRQKRVKQWQRNVRRAFDSFACELLVITLVILYALIIFTDLAYTAARDSEALEWDEATLAALSSELHSLQVKREEKAPGRLQKRRVGESTLAAMSIELRRLQVKAEAER